MTPVGQSVVIAVDPGRCKCGVAVVRGGTGAEVLHRAVVLAEEIRATLVDLCTVHCPDVILLGNGTTSADVAKAAEGLAVHVELVDEKFTSVAARKRYFVENPPRGFRRLIPLSMQTPSQPYDDYVAVILAERYLAARQSSSS